MRTNNQLWWDWICNEFSVVYLGTACVEVVMSICCLGMAHITDAILWHMVRFGPLGPMGFDNEPNYLVFARPPRWTWASRQDCLFFWFLGSAGGVILFLGHGSDRYIFNLSRFDSSPHQTYLHNFILLARSLGSLHAGQWAPWICGVANRLLVVISSRLHNYPVHFSGYCSTNLTKTTILTL